MDLDALIVELLAMREESRLGGSTAVCLCFEGIEYVPVDGVLLEQDDAGALALICPSEFNVVQSISMPRSSNCRLQR